MPASPQKVSIVVVGQFNHAILVPSWLSKHALIQAGPWQTQMQIDQGGNVLVRHRAGAVEWRVDRGRLIIERDATEAATVEMTEIVDFATGVLAKLPHTPVLAVGMNFIFNLSKPVECRAGRVGLPDVAGALGGAPRTSSAKFAVLLPDGFAVNVDIGHVAEPGTGTAPSEHLSTYNFHRAATSVEDVVAALKNAARYLGLAVAANGRLTAQATSS